MLEWWVGSYVCLNSNCRSITQAGRSPSFSSFWNKIPLAFNSIQVTLKFLLHLSGVQESLIMKCNFQKTYQWQRDEKNHWESIYGPWISRATFLSDLIWANNLSCCITAMRFLLPISWTGPSSSKGLVGTCMRWFMKCFIRLWMLWAK